MPHMERLDRMYRLAKKHHVTMAKRLMTQVTMHFRWPGRTTGDRRLFHSRTLQGGRVMDVSYQLVVL